MSMSIAPDVVAKVVQMRAQGVGAKPIAEQLSVPYRQVTYIIETRRKLDPDFDRACREHPARRGHTKPPHYSSRTRKSVRQQVKAGAPVQAIVGDTQAPVDYIHAVEVSERTGLDVGDVPATWAGAFRRLAEFVKGRDAEAYEFARTIAKAKGVRL